MKEKIKSLSIVVIGLASLITATTVLISVPNSLLDYLKTRNWDENIKIIRFSSNDYIVIYNGNPKPIFINRYDFTDHKVGISGSGEINQTVAPYSYLNYLNPDKINWDLIFKGNETELQKIIKTGINRPDSPYKYVFFNESHPTFKLFSRTNNMPSTFDFYAVLTVNFENQEKVFPFPSKGIIVSKTDLNNIPKNK
ncbi:hypothetical protein SHI21_13450 [Bacteriovorax sp. PP10]|uniref:Uncharacterized protein n=1 Tax=Bacteriovorax antarcticus TaxID=3088717 RepID=A0ABU5VY31_9BACT|nr:hypothetical protein [Bacteriovorax sp. PP10]MEA9357224.1 hypothetical protein [Bacteriovorax sp. PP10]